VTATIDRARPYMAALASELIKDEAIRTGPWAEAFATVPRHVFVPHWFQQETNEKGITVWRQHHGATDDATLSAVYSNKTLVTALDPTTAEQVDTTAWTGVPTSSSTLPSLMAGMLEDLDVSDGHRVLEIGTGTGYNAALLSARLGDRFVHSVDIDPELVDAAGRRLADAGYAPHLTTGDGTLGYPGGGGAFDRIIATCSVPSVPEGWLDQSKSGTVLVTDVALGIEGGIVRLSVDEPRQARGRFTKTAGRFMAARTEARTYASPQRPQRAPQAETRPTALTAAHIRTNYPFRLLLALQLPEAELVYHMDDATGTTAIQIQQPDGSWARVPLNGDITDMVTYGGDPGLWDRAEDAWLWWNKVGRPSQDSFGYSREQDGTAYAWYIPDGTRWNLSTTA